jgi:hypothetical protein
VFPFIADLASKEKLPDYLARFQYIDGTEGDGFSDLAKPLRSVLDA